MIVRAGLCCVECRSCKHTYVSSSYWSAVVCWYSFIFRFCIFLIMATLFFLYWTTDAYRRSVTVGQFRDIGLSVAQMHWSNAVIEMLSCHCAIDYCTVTTVSCLVLMYHLYVLCHPHASCCVHLHRLAPRSSHHMHCQCVCVFSPVADSRLFHDYVTDSMLKWARQLIDW